MIIDCVSDLHGEYPKLEGGDLLIVAGDLFLSDDVSHCISMLAWLESLEYNKIVFVAGNHDNFLKQHGYPSTNRISYLLDSGTEFQGLNIWGSPWTKAFKGINPNRKAFTLETKDELALKFSFIPSDTDILITHSPPWTIGDMTNRSGQVGNITLMGMFVSGILRPKLWVFGHVHEGYSRTTMPWADTILVNASHLNELYEPVNAPVRVIL